jgi:hypothetical protein
MPTFKSGSSKGEEEIKPSEEGNSKAVLIKGQEMCWN